MEGNREKTGNTKFDSFLINLEEHLESKEGASDLVKSVEKEEFGEPDSIDLITRVKNLEIAFSDIDKKVDLLLIRVQKLIDMNLE